MYVGYVFFSPNGFCALQLSTQTCDRLTLVKFAISGLFTVKAVCPTDNSQITLQIPVHNEYLANPGAGSSPASAYPNANPTSQDTYQGNGAVPEDCNDDYQVFSSESPMY